MRRSEYSMLAGEQVKKYGRENDLVDRIAADPDFGMTKEEIVSILEPKNFVGRAPEQTRESCRGHSAYPR